MPKKSKTEKCHCCEGSGRAQNHLLTGLKMRDLRLRNGLGLREVARYMGVSHTYLYHLEIGVRRWTPALEKKFKYHCEL